MEASLKDGDKKEQWRGLATSFKTKSSKSLERRRNKLEAQSKPDTRPRINYKEWFLIPLLTLAEVGSPSGRPRPACLPDPTKKRRISQTIDQELKLPKNESSSSGLDDQQTENATEETTLIPQIKKGVHKVLITSTPYTIHCALLLYIYSKLWKDNLTIVITQGTLPRSPQLYCVYAIPRPGAQF
ncbi:hypothetical protein BY996DRAFT_6410416 [Phakopsora pachyrhizi]|nr:hypothetical protein BY996DRAFT_6410416 [Phakopsora pachyrhizi]